MAKIILAEDDSDMRRFLVKALQNAGYDVISFDNGLSAYQRLREEPFELLLTDIVMPEMDGIELARRASELDPDIKIMFITGFAAVALNSDFQGPQKAKGLSKAVHPPGLVTQGKKNLAAGGAAPLFPPAGLRHMRVPAHPPRARSSAEEHYLDMVGVTGSIPVAPTIKISAFRSARPDSARAGSKLENADWLTRCRSPPWKCIRCDISWPPSASSISPRRPRSATFPSPPSPGPSSSSRAHWAAICSCV